jgi:membrane protease YdiL (CAAX protease family)
MSAAHPAPRADRASQSSAPSRTTGVPSSRLWTVLTAAEVVAAAAAVLLDLLVPTIVLLAMACVSLLIRHEGFGSLGVRRVPFVHLALVTLGLAAAWSVFQLAVTMPIANHLSGQQQDLSAFRDLEGNVGLLVGLLALSWTLAAVGEELAYRGYLQTRMRQLFGAGRAGLVGAVLASSLLFGFAHSEQGVIGVAIVTLDAIFFSVLRYRYRTLWASVLAHGFNNTIGFVAFFLVGPIHGLW